jgi:hypothetical protein
MENTLHPLIAYHPVAVAASLMGRPIGGVAEQDAEPLPEPAPRPVRPRLLSLLQRPRPATA